MLQCLGLHFFAEKRPVFQSLNKSLPFYVKIFCPHYRQPVLKPVQTNLTLLFLRMPLQVLHSLLFICNTHHLNTQPVPRHQIGLTLHLTRMCYSVMFSLKSAILPIHTLSLFSHLCYPTFSEDPSAGTLQIPQWHRD